MAVACEPLAVPVQRRQANAVLLDAVRQRPLGRQLQPRRQEQPYLLRHRPREQLVPRVPVAPQTQPGQRRRGEGRGGPLGRLVVAV